MIQDIKNIFHLLEALLANILFGFPSKKLKVLAITGTDGKTTTTTLLYHILRKADYKVALISTVAAYIGEDEIDTGFHVTTPSSFALQRLLAKIAKQKIDYVILETTSHGIDQNRIWGIHPTIAAITNVTHEHLDYHKTFENYLRTKARLLLRSDLAIVNKDAKESDEMLEGVLQSAGKEFELASIDKLPRKVRQAVFTRFGDQEYNYQNTAVAFAIAKHLEVKEKDIVTAITHFPGVPGRMEEVLKHRGIRVIVDFAHTPNALEVALQSLQDDRKKGRVITVFGCAGLRDHTKRPLMGAVATKLSDLVVLTSEDPRTEDVWSIIAQIKSGVEGNHGKIVSIADRYQAIQFALLELAKSGDTVIITGKGHEKSMCYGETEYPWSDQEAVKKIMNQ